MNSLRTLTSIMLLVAASISLFTCDEPEKPKPEITQINPSSGAIGTDVIITGKNLSSTKNIKFGAVSTLPASKDDTKITTAVPTGTVPGDLNVTVETEGGTSNSLSFEVLHSVPEVTGLEPDKGSIGMLIAIKGNFLSTVSKVTFGSIDITSFESKAEAEIKVKVPSEVPIGALNLSVTTQGGTSIPETFTVVGKPAISSIDPAVGPVGRIVEINGSHFEDASKVFFGPSGDAQFVYKNATLLEATVPATATTGKVRVITPGGEAVSVTDFVVKDAPEVSSFTPLSGVVGTVVTITGKGFETGILVKFGTGNATDVTVVNSTTMTAKVPASGTTGKITVETLAGSGLSPNSFTVIGAPTITSFSPASGIIGAEITITGTNFTGVTGVKFNNTAVSAANYTVLSGTQIKAKVPSGAVSGKISVTTNAGTGTSGNDFTVSVPPTITSFNPPNGLTGSNVVVTGTGFANITSVKINEIEVGAANYTVNSSTQITAKVPSNGTSGKIKVTNSLGTATSTNTFYVTPFISTINPTQASAGSPITITGTNLENAKVKFNATEVTPSNNSGTSIIVNSPAGVTGAMNVTVVNLGGTSNSKTFTATAPVVVDEIISTSNIVNQLILLRGTNLLGATKVWFGAVQANVLTSTYRVVTAIIPASLSDGSYAVKVETTKGTSNEKSFQVLSTQSANTGGATLTTGTTIASYTAPVAPPIANFWSNVSASETPDEAFFFLDVEDGQFNVRFSVDGFDVDEGVGTYDHSYVDGVMNNYIDFTVNGVRYVGVWTPHSTEEDEFGDPYCLAHMTLISAESGKQLKLAVNFADECP